MTLTTLQYRILSEKETLKLKEVTISFIHTENFSFLSYSLKNKIRKRRVPLLQNRWTSTMHSSTKLLISVYSTTSGYLSLKRKKNRVRYLEIYFYIFWGKKSFVYIRDRARNNFSRTYFRFFIFFFPSVGKIVGFQWFVNVKSCMITLKVNSFSSQQQQNKRDWRKVFALTTFTGLSSCIKSISSFPLYTCFISTIFVD